MLVLTSTNEPKVVLRFALNDNFLLLYLLLFYLKIINCHANSIIHHKELSLCNSLFEHCLCSFNEHTRRNFLYCNDKNIRKVPDFRKIYSQYNAQQTQTRYRNANLLFSKVDFGGSSIRRIRKDDLNYLQIDLLPTNLKSFNNNNINNNKNKSSSLLGSNEALNVENLLEQLKQTFVPNYHLDFDNIIDIDDAAFDTFIKTNINLTYQLALASVNEQSNAWHSGEQFVKNRRENLLKLRFSNSFLNFASTRRPFAGLRALELHLTNLSNEYLANSIFDQSEIDEFYIENSPNFIGFLDLGNQLPNGKLMHRFIIVRSYKIEQLCSHSLPSFVNQETFHDITIRKCTNLRSIKPYTFHKYSHLKTLNLNGNNFTSIQRNSFRYLNHLELLDLSHNPILFIEDDSFSDLSSLKYFYLESTLLKQIGEKTLSGLVSLVHVKFSKSFVLDVLHSDCFNDSKKTLKEIHLKDTRFNLIDYMDQDKEHEPLFAPYVPYNFTPMWLENLNLSLLNLENSNTEASLNETSPRLLCKIFAYLRRKPLLIQLSRNQPCNCLIYLIYRAKSFTSYPHWEFKTPFCYRNQIQNFENGTKSFSRIRERELECSLDTLQSLCFSSSTTTSTVTTSTPTTRSSTCPTLPKETTTTKRRLRPKPMVLFANQSTPIQTTKKAPTFPKLDFAKFFKVILVIALISVLSILLTCLGLAINSRINRRKKDAKQLQTKKEQSMRLRPSSSNASSMNLSRTSESVSGRAKLVKGVVMSPSVIQSITKPD